MDGDGGLGDLGRDGDGGGRLHSGDRDADLRGGETEKTFDVAVTGDTGDEDDETYTVTLSNAGIRDATGTITDDD